MDLFVELMCEALVHELETALLTMTFNRVRRRRRTDVAHSWQLGGLQWDKDLRHVIAFMSAATPTMVRDKFVRLVQMAILLNLEHVRGMH